MVYALAAILVGISVILTGFALISFARCAKASVGLSLPLLLAALAVYSGGYAGELLSKSLNAMLFWNTVQYLAIPFIPTLWILFTSRYVNVQRLFGRSPTIVLLALSITTLLGALTDEVFHLRYAAVWINVSGRFPHLAFARGPLYWTHTAYSFIALMVGSTLLVHALLTTPRFFRRQLILMLAGTTLPWINYIFYLSGINFHGIDTIPFSMFLSAVCFGTAIFRYRILDVIPVARSLVFDTMEDGAIVLDNQGRIADFNRSAAAVLGELGRDAISRDAEKILSRHETLCLNIEMNVEADFTFTLGENDARRTYLCKISFIRNREGAPAGRILIIKDSTETTLLLNKLKELAAVDSLTGLYNRRHFMDLARRQISILARGKRPMSLIILDLDNFKRLNDTHGHLAGDVALKMVARALSSQLRAGDILARFGGEEFICLLSEAGSAEAPIIAERMRAAIKKASIAIEGAETLAVTASFGVNCVDEVSGEESIDALISRADSALYEAKADGRNRVRVYEPRIAEETTTTAKALTP